MDISIKLNFIRLEPNFFKTLLLIAWALKQPVTFTRLVDPSCKMNVMVLLESLLEALLPTTFPELLLMVLPFILLVLEFMLLIGKLLLELF